MEIAAPRATLTVDAIQRLLDASVARAKELGIRVHVAVMDASAELAGWISFDGAPRLAAHTARGKAMTAVHTGMSTRKWGDYVASIPAEEQQIIHGIGGYIGADGGFPVMVSGMVVGGIGVSGASQALDADVARAALAAIGAVPAKE
jgi:uncharacterized protein GlcG (DUF336 family)